MKQAEAISYAVDCTFLAEFMQGKPSKAASEKRFVACSEHFCGEVVAR